MIREYLAEHEPDYGAQNIDNMIGFLHRCYTERNPIENDWIREKLRDIERYFPYLNVKEYDAVIDAVMAATLAVEQMSFREGFLSGARVMQEIMDTQQGRKRF